MSKAHVVIVGAGIIGLASARELALRNYEVTVIDKGDLGRGASRAGGGIVSPLRPWQAHTVVDRLAAHSQALYGDFVEAVYDESGIDPEYLQSGMLVVGDTHRAAATEWARQTERTLEVVDRSVLTDLVPDIGRMREGVFMPNIYQVRNPSLLEALIASVQKLGVHIESHREVTRLLHDEYTILGVETQSGPIRADGVVIAAGAWSGTFTHDLGLRFNVTPVRGQVVWFEDTPERAARPIVDDGEHYVVTRGDGVTLVGSTVENVGFDQGITDKAMKRLVNKARNLILGLGQLKPKGQWAGLRPARAHGIPLIGAHPRAERLYLNTGHFRNGVTLAPGSASILADVLDGTGEAGVGVSTL